VSAIQACQRILKLTLEEIDNQRLVAPKVVLPCLNGVLIVVGSVQVGIFDVGFLFNLIQVLVLECESRERSV
jgi:hypothetical protein